MRGFYTYFYLQLKRVFKIFPFVIAVSLVLALGLVVFLSGYIKSDQESEEKQMFGVGIVGDTEDSYLGLGINALQTFDSSRFAIDIVEMTEDEAKESLIKGDIAAYAVVPDGFVKHALRGEILPLKYVSTDGAVGITTIFKDEITKVISEMLIHSQKGVYGMEQIADDNGADGGKLMNDLSIKYVDLILSRSNIADVEIVGVSDGLSLPGYFLCGIITLFLMMFGITCAPIFVKGDMSLSRVIAAKGITPAKQVIAEFFAYFIVLMIIVLLIVTGLGVVSLSGLELIPELIGLEVIDFVDIAVRFIPLTAMLAAFHFILYEITSGIVSGVLLQFLTVVSLAYVSGCLYPVNFLPESMQKLSNVLPSGLARSHVSGCVSYSDPSGAVPGILLYFALFISGAILIRKYKIEGRRV